MEIPPTECFDKVLCASDDENPDVKKTMYNWWRAFFEVLGKCDKMPKDREAEFKQKVDALMSEIMKAGDKEASGNNEVVLEDGYEEADKAEEDEMNKDFDFAIQHIGEIANKVKDVVNFINPYCESIGGTSKMNENEVREFVKSIGFRPDSDGIDYETQLVDALTGKDTSYNAGWGAVYYNSDKVLQYLKKFGMLGSRGIKQKEAISKLRRLFKSGKWKTQQDEQFNEVNDTMKKTNEMGDSVWVPMKEIIGTTIGESEDQPGEFQVGDRVMWKDPEYDEWTDGWTVISAPEEGFDVYDDMYTIENDDGSEAEVLGCELRSAEMMKESWYPEHGIGEVVSWKDENDEMQDGWTVIGCDVNTFEYHLEKDGEDVWVDDIRVDEYNESKQVSCESDWGGKSTTRTLNFTKWEVDGLMDYIAEEIAHLEDEASGLNITGIVPKRILEYIEMKGFASSVKKLDPKEVIIKWADGSGVDDDFAPAKGNSKSVYDLVKDIYKGDSEYSESKVASEGSIKMTPEQRKVVDNAKKTAKKDGYDQYIILDKEDGSWSFARKHIQDKSEFDKFNQEVVGIVTSDDLQYKPYSLDESDEQKPDEVKGGEKKFKKDGETKTLVTGSDKEINNKQEVTEMTIEQEVSNPWSLAELMWGQGKENLEDLLRAEVVDEEVLMRMLEDMDIHNLTALNDAFAFDFESILEMVGCDPHAWSQNLEIKKAGGDSEED